MTYSAMSVVLQKSSREAHRKQVKIYQGVKFFSAQYSQDTA